MDYREAGVDISAADAAKARIKGLARATFNASVLTEIGSFGGMFRPDLSRYREPVLVASTDGVGTKIKVAILAGVHDTVGYDLVAHCVDDILVQGAVPLFFLDYVALGKMDPVKVEQIVSGFSRACAEFGCPLIGGETAEMPGTYAEDDYDLAGLHRRGGGEGRRRCRAACARATSSSGCPRLGLHTNGYSLARKVLLEALGHRVDTHLPELGTTVGRGAARAPPQLPRRPRAAPRAGQGAGPRPHHRRRLPRQHPARPARGARGAPAPGLVGGAAPLPPHPEGRGRLRRGDGAHLQHGRSA